MFRPVLRIEPDAPPAPGAEPVEESQGLLFFIEKHFDRTFVAHSGGQNAFETHFYYHPETRTAYAVAFNTLAVTEDDKPGDSKASTGKLDKAVRDFLFTKIFPLLPAKK